jgi:hypothetical protein
MSAKNTVPDRITSFFDSDKEVIEALEIAEGQASTSFEIGFVKDLKARFDRFAMDSFMSEKQFAVLDRLVNKQHR